MRNLEEVTNEEMKAVYHQTPSLFQFFSFDEVMLNPALVISLKNQIISHEEKQMEKPNNVILLPVTVPSPRFVRAEIAQDNVSQIKKTSRRSTITLHEKQIEKIKMALVLSRNCLKYGGMSDAVRHEALDSLAESQKIIQSFYEPRV